MTAPANNNFANRITISGTEGTVGPVTIDEATVQGGEDVAFDANHQTIWYEWVAPYTGRAAFTTKGSLAGDSGSGDGDTANYPPFGALDTRLAVWQGSALGSLTQIISGDDSGSNYYSAVDFDAVQGETYLIQIGTYDEPYTGTVILSWSPFVDAPRPGDRTSSALTGSSSAVTNMPICEPGDVVFMIAVCQGDSATMTAPAGWTELSSFTVPAAAAPYPNGALAKVWYREIEAYGESPPTITKDTSRNGVGALVAIEGPIDMSIVEVTTPVQYAAETHFGTPPTISPYASGHRATILTVIAAADNYFVTNPPNVNDMQITFGSGTSNGSGVTFGVAVEQDLTNDSFFPSNYTMLDNPSFAGTHYAPSAVVTIAIYGDVPSARKWYIGAAPSASPSSGGQAAWDGGQYMYQLQVYGSGASTTGRFFRYDIANDTWDELTGNGHHRNYYGSAVHDGKVFLFGGQEGTNGSSTAAYVRTVRIYDIATDTWSTGATMPPFRIGKLVSGIDGSVTSFDVDEDTSDPFFSGASSSGIFWIDNEHFRMSADRTHVSGNVYTYHVVRAASGTIGGALPHSADAEVSGGGFALPGGYLDYPCAVTSGNRIYLVGGFGMGTNEAVDNSMFIYNPVADTWQQGSRMPAGQDSGNAVVDGDGLIHAIGTNIDGVDSSEVVWATGFPGIQEQAHQVYDPDTDEWTVLPNMPAVDSNGRDVEAYEAASLYDPTIDTIITIPFQNLGNPGNTNADDRLVETYNVGTDTWGSEPDIDADTFTGFTYNSFGSGLYGARRVFIFDNSGTGFPAVFYYDITVPDEGGAGFDEWWDVLHGFADDQDAYVSHHITHEPDTGLDGGDNVDGAWAYALAFASADTWIVEHNLGGHPRVIVTIGGEQVEAEITYDSDSQITVRFSTAQAGRVQLS